jgi:hypothetical protein
LFKFAQKKAEFFLSPVSVLVAATASYSNFCQDVERMILGNKCDMTDKRVISKERGEAIAREHNIRLVSKYLK